MKTQMLRFGLWLGGLALVSVAIAQAPMPPPPPAPPAPPAADVLMATAGGFTGPNVHFIAAEPAMLGKPVTGAPYSAEAVTETVRTLGDGTRIQASQTTRIYRDSEGRTRQERPMPARGAADGTEQRVQVMISDPANRTFTVLDPQAKTARVVKLPALPHLPRKPAPPVPGSSSTEADIEVVEGPRPGQTYVFSQSSTRESSSTDRVERTDENGRTVVVERRVELRGDVPVAAAPAIPPMPPMPPIPEVGAGGFQSVQMTWIRNPELVEMEGLGERMIEGLTAKGGRRTSTIPEGAIGNDRPITSIDEEWTSPELQVTLLRTTKDPQVGEITYRLTNIHRGEPLKDLFEIPPDFKVVEGGPGAMRIELRTMPEMP
jgi:hypothetical protein